MNRDLSKFEPPKTKPDGHTKELFGMPRITCPACGNPDIRGHRNGGYIEISCSKCGTSLERLIVEDVSPLENVVDLVNEYEQIRYKVNKSKEV